MHDTALAHSDEAFHAVVDGRIADSQVVSFCEDGKQLQAGIRTKNCRWCYFAQIGSNGSSRWVYHRYANARESRALSELDHDGRLQPGEVVGEDYIVNLVWW